MRFADCELDVDRWEMRCRDELVSLEPRAMSILVHLVEVIGSLTHPEGGTTLTLRGP